MDCSNFEPLMMTLTVPNHEAAEFSNLPDDVRKEVYALIRVFAPLFDKRKRPAHIGHYMNAAAAELGLSPRTLRNKYDALRNGTTKGVGGEKRYFAPLDWRILVNYCKAQPVAASLPNEFIAFWKELCELNQRKCRPAYRFLVRGYQKRRFVMRNRVLTNCPGYAAWPLAEANGLPAGWSYRNLMEHQPSKFERVAMREGLGKALAKHGPKVLSTRVGLWVGSHYFFDDVKRDFKALLISRNQMVNIQELGCLDYCSGDRFAVHRRPQYEEDGRKNSLKERETRFLVASVLRNVGYSPRGTTMVTELGTAAIRDALAEFLYEHSDKLITRREPGIAGREQAIAGYWGRGGGNPRHKAPIESHHNLGQNEAGMLPAQTGHDRNPPEWLHGVEAITQSVCKGLATLARDRAELLMPGMLEYWQSLALLGGIDRLIAWRIDHNLEGWLECGHSTVEFRRHPQLEDQWLGPRELLALPAPERELIHSAAMLDARFRRARKLAPREVFACGSADLIRFPDHVIALMFCDDRLGEDLRETKRLNAEGCFDVSEKLAGPERMLFRGRSVVTPKNETIALDERAEYGVVLNPWDTSALWVYAPKGGFLGTAPRIVRQSQLDVGGMQRALGEREHEIAQLLTPLRDRHANAAAEMLQLQEHNELVRSGAPITLHERMQVLSDAKNDDAAEKFFASQATPFVQPINPRDDDEEGD
jgi:hypothetical protein